MTLELWAGAECTVNRVGDRFRDQLEHSGFSSRLEDLDRLASLGVRRLRFPLLWERTAPQSPDQQDWRWADTRIGRLHELGIVPIVGLLHHGSGPPYTNLLDAKFPGLFARYALSVAERFPDVEAYTPVNEPLTTARFSGLYGIWYPHCRDDMSFVQALLNQVKATVLAMRAIRSVNPRAQLVQTDDLGHTDSCALLQYQADFDNARRWLAFDLLAGRVDRRHRLWRYLRKFGASEGELLTLVDEPCVPDIVGINYYVTSERFLDNRLSLYPPLLCGGNGRHRYADVEAVRVCGREIGGFAARLREAWERYRLPVAITEAHLGSTRDEQLRWLHQAWMAAQAVSAEGVDVRAVTAWAAFGTVDWNTLVTRESGCYEAGLWDVRAATPRPTAVATLALQLAQGREPDHPVLGGPGWWQRDVRLVYPPHGQVQARPIAGRVLLISGATGTLGQAFARMCTLRGLPHRLLSRGELDIADARGVESALERWEPWAFVNTAGYVRVDDAERAPEQWRENALGPAVLAQACAQRGIRLLTFSSDLVFDGNKSLPYLESDAPRPLNAYGRGKHEAERRVLELDPAALVIRTSAFFGPWDRFNFVTLALEAISRGERWRAPHDQFISPTYVPDLVQSSLDLLVDGESGVWHLANRGAVSWAQFAQLAVEAAQLDVALVEGLPGAALGQVARRPRYSALGSERGVLMPSLHDGIERYVGAMREHRDAAALTVE